MTTPRYPNFLRDSLWKIVPKLSKVPIAEEYWRDSITPLSADEDWFWISETGIKDEAALQNHLHAVRDAAYQVVQEFSIARWWFLKNIMAANPYYHDILAAARQGSTIIDLGCGFGQDLGRLRADGASGKCYGVDERPALWDLGQKLFKEPADRKWFREIDINSRRIFGAGESISGIEEDACIFLLNDVISFWGVLNILGVFDTIRNASKVGTQVLGWVIGQEGDQETVGDAKMVGIQGFLGRGVILTLDEFQKWFSETLTTELDSKTWVVEAQMVDFDTMGFDDEDQKWFKSNFWDKTDHYPLLERAPNERPNELKAICFLATRLA